MDKHALFNHDFSLGIVQLVSKYPKKFFNKPNYMITKNHLQNTTVYFDYPVAAKYGFTLPDLVKGP